MKSLFRSFEKEGVRYLLIGGQAAILYGASHFTQDLDLWVDPAPANWKALLRALARVRATVYKLTPPLTQAFVRRGHGFHFLIPQRSRLPAYLDVMGRPPRVGQFRTAAGRAEKFRTPWGEIPVASIEDMVDLTRTNRPGDYEVISRLVKLRLSRESRLDPPLLNWALDNCFRNDDALEISTHYGGLLPPGITRRHRWLRGAGSGRLESAMDRRLLASLKSGRDYWSPRISELRRLKPAGKLIPEGTPVANLLPS
ncbi:MAG: hypothetical protein HYY18_10210 [Planctomycetes bacterium]|nr:hypothetical protein [Planctomycetota bacterium]